MRDLDDEFDSSDVIRCELLAERELPQAEDTELEAVLATLVNELSAPVRVELTSRDGDSSARRAADARA